MSQLDAYDSLLIEKAQGLCKAFNLKTKVKRVVWLNRMLGMKINSAVSVPTGSSVLIV